MSSIEEKNKAKLELFLLCEKNRLNSELSTTFEEDKIYKTKILNLPEEILCPLCYEIMNSAETKPMTLFPCGHVICNSCYSKVKLSGNCNVCNSQVKNAAINYTLANIIDNENYSKPINVNKDDLEYISKRLSIFSTQLSDIEKQCIEYEEDIEHLEERYDDLKLSVEYDLEQINVYKNIVTNIERELSLLRDEEKLLKTSLKEQTKVVEKLNLITTANK